MFLIPWQEEECLLVLLLDLSCEIENFGKLELLCVFLFFFFNLFFFSLRRMYIGKEIFFRLTLLFVPKNQHLSQEVGIAFSFFMLQNPYTVKTLDWKFKEL